MPLAPRVAYNRLLLSAWVLPLVGLCLELREETVEVGGHDVESVVVGGVGELDGHADLVDKDGAAVDLEATRVGKPWL